MIAVANSFSNAPAFLEPDLRFLLNYAPSVRLYDCREEIIRADATPELLVVVEGWAARCNFLSDGRRQLPGVFLPGDVCNLDNLFAKKNRFSVTALTSCVVAVLPMEKIRILTQTSANMRDLLWRLAIVSGAVSTQWICSLGRRSTREGLAHLLCELKVRLDFAEMSEDGLYTIPLTQTDLGDALGVSSVHINRTLQSFRNECLITFKDKILQLLEPEALQEIARFDPVYLKRN